MTAEAEIRRRIEERGKISFAEFMEVALYWPEGGYYMARTLLGGGQFTHTHVGGGQSPDQPSLDEGPFGAAGDYYTSPLVHPAFGALLSVQLFQMWQVLGKPKPFAVVELGCGNGQLARDILAHEPAAAGRVCRIVWNTPASIGGLRQGRNPPGRNYRRRVFGRWGRMFRCGG